MALPGQRRFPAEPGARRFYFVLVFTATGPVRVFKTRSGPVAIAIAETSDGWVEGDDHSMIWPHRPEEGEGWQWARTRTFEQQ